MNRRQFLIGAIGAGLVTTFLLKPSDSGASYSPYFKELNDELMENGPYKPSMVVDLDRMNRNIQHLLQGLSPDLHYRIVAKSLPSPELLGHIMKEAETNRLMVFHQPFLSHIAEKFPKSDVLLGKPMPIKSAEIFYSSFSNSSGFDPSRQLQWLIDDRERLVQYRELARELEIKMRVSIEIDIGLHRGGLQSPDELAPLLDIILANPDRLELGGFMGYDPHVVKLPKIVKSAEQAYAESQQIYQGFLDLVKIQYPQIDIAELCLNGAGSPTIALHKKETVINDMSAGSCLVKPVDFDIDTLQEFLPASYIATPVLKKADSMTIPSLESLKGVLNWWDPNTRQSFFIYGGKWMAKYESPVGLQESGLYGTSTNQQLVTGSGKIDLDVDDHVFLRPNQSEFVFLQFGDLLTVKDQKIVGRWPILKQ